MAEMAGKEASETARSAVSSLYFNLLFMQIKITGSQVEARDGCAPYRGP